jgi:adenylylsulfate kinase
VPERAFTLWCTGLSAAGKSTLCEAVAGELGNRGMRVAWLDGDEVRRELSHGLGFSREDRVENARRVAYVAATLNRYGVSVLVSLISPYKEMRAIARETVGDFVETYVKCSIAQCAERDPKALYAKAMRGEVKAFTGISDPYEEPERPELTVDTEALDRTDAVGHVMGYLEESGRVPAAGMRQVRLELAADTFSRLDVAATDAGLSGPEEFLRLVASEAAGSLSPIADSAVADEPTQDDEVVLARLRDLGYID